MGRRRSALGLVGDIGLMLSRGDTDLPFLAGLAAFLVGHVGYVVAFLLAGVRTIDVVAGLLIVLGMLGARAAEGAARGGRLGRGAFAGIVAAYAAVLAAMAVLARRHRHRRHRGRRRAVPRLRHRHRLAALRAPAAGTATVVVIVSYHLAQFLILLGLVRRL